MTKSIRLVAGAAVLGLFAMAASAAAEDDVRLRLNWMWYGSHAPFALGKDKGYFKENGINLDVRSGNGSGSAHRRITPSTALTPPGSLRGT